MVLCFLARLSAKVDLGYDSQAAFRFRQRSQGLFIGIVLSMSRFIGNVFQNQVFAGPREGRGCSPETFLRTDFGSQRHNVAHMALKVAMLCEMLYTRSQCFLTAPYARCRMSL